MGASQETPPIFAAISPANIGRLTETLQARCGFITEAAWSPDGQTLAVAHGGGVWLWQGGFGGDPSVKLEHGAPVKGIAFSPDSKVIATASSDTNVQLWIVSAGKAFYNAKGHTDSVNSVAISPNGRLLASGGGDQRVRLVDMMDSRGSTFLSGHEQEITKVAFALGNTTLASASWDKTIRLWDTSLHEARAILPHEDWVRDIAVSADGKLIGAACKDGRIYLWDAEYAQLIRSFEAHAGGADTVAFSPNNDLIATGGRDNAFALWSLEGEKFAAHTAHDKPVLAIAFNPLGTMLLTGSGDNALKLWMIK